MQPLTDDQKKLVTDYQPAARRLAEARSRHVPREVDPDDLMSAANLGLIDAAQKFDPSRGVKFGTYMGPRVKGAMADYLREIDPLPRAMRERTNAWGKAVQMFYMEHGRLPAEGEVEYPIVVCEAVDKGDYHAPAFTSMNAAATADDNGDESSFVSGMTFDGEAPATRADRADLRRAITRCLDRDERLIVALYYFEGMGQKEIGKVLGVSDSRVSQMRSAIIERLKASVGKAVLQ